MSHFLQFSLLAIFAITATILSICAISVARSLKTLCNKAKVVQIEESNFKAWLKSGQVQDPTFKI